jgi:WD40 repeat protein/predicted Ser/Thr protein kinase
VRYFGDYELIKELGRGAMGVVYKARQISLNRPVAVKLLKADILAGDDERRRFENEAEVVAMLDHPHIVPIFEVGEHEGRQYFTMKLVTGTSLDKKLAHYAADPKVAARLVKTAAEAVHHAHQRGILHRDLKPSNILLDDRGEPYVSDYGLAKRIEGDSELTVSGAIVGTPSYMSPEQASGRRGAVTTSTDVYGLGAILYSLLTGRPPFRGNSVLKTLREVQERAPDPPSMFNPKVPRHLEAICLKCLQKDPSRRYASAKALANDLESYLAFRPIEARFVGRVERTTLWCRRNPIAACLTMAIAVAAVASLVGLLSVVRSQALAREVAREQELTFRSQYDFRILQVQGAWDKNDLVHLRDLLAYSTDGASAHNDPALDPRGFEWYFWRRKLSSGHQSFIGRSSVAFSPDGQRIAFVTDNGVQVTEMMNGHGTRVLNPKSGAGWIESAATCPDGGKIASGDSIGMIRLIDRRTSQELLMRGHTRSVTGLAFSPNCDRLASSSADRTVRLWDVATGREICSFQRHTDRVSGVSYSPDGNRIASGSYDGTIRIWDSMTGLQSLEIRGDAGPVLSVAFSPDGRRLAAADSFKGIRVRDAISGEVRSILGQARDSSLRGYTCAAYSTDGRRLAAARSDSTLTIWDTSNGQELVALKGHSSPVVSLAFSPDGTKLASASDIREVKVWDVINGQRPPTISAHTGPVFDVLFSPDGRRLATTGRDSTVRLWDLENCREIMSLEGPAGKPRRHIRPMYDAAHTQQPITAIAFRPDGERLAAAGAKGVMVWEAATGRLILAYKGHTDLVTAIAFSPDGKHLATSGCEGVVKVWDGDNGNEKLTLTGRFLNKDPRSRNDASARSLGGDASFGRTSDEGYLPILDLAYSPDGQRIASLDEKGILLWNAQTGSVVWALDENDNLVNVFERLTFSPDGKLLAVFDRRGTLKLVSAVDGREIRDLESPPESQKWIDGMWRDAIRKVAFSPDGSSLAVTRVGGKIQLLDVADGKVLVNFSRRSPRPVSAFSVAFSADGKRIASADGYGAVVWDVATAGEIVSIVGRSGAVYSVTYYPDGSRFATSGEDGLVRVFDAATFQESLRLKGENVAISPDGTRIASSDDNTMRLWDSATGQELLVCTGHTGRVTSISFAPDGSRVASASADGTVRVWDVRNGETIVIIGPGSKDVFSSVTFSPDGRLLAGSISYFSGFDIDHRYVKAWNAATGATMYDLDCGRAAKVAFSHVNSLLATISTGRDGDVGWVNVWQATDGRWVRSIRGGKTVHAPDSVNDVTFSPDDGRLASAYQDGTVRISDTVTGLETLVLEGHTAAVLAVAFSPDGQQLVSASADGTVKVWDARRLDTE